jgi:glycosyltransferase involved in cell wall biosynthesis
MKQFRSLWIIANADFPEGRGGTPRIRNIAVGLAGRGHRVRILLPHAAGFVSADQNCRPRGEFSGVHFEFLHDSVHRPSTDIGLIAAKLLGNLKLFWRFLTGRRPDAVLIYNYSLLDTGLLIGAAKLLGTKVIYDVCDERFELHAVDHPKGIARRINALHYRISDIITLRIVDGVLVVSEYLLEKVLRSKPNVKYLMLPLVADMHVAGSEYGAARGTMAPEFAYVGSLIADEGIHMLVEALLILRVRYPGACCHLYGDFNNEVYKEKLFRFLKERGAENVLVFHGNTAYGQLVAEVASKHAMVLPRPDSIISRAGFPGKLSEYLASKRPLVTTRFGDIARYFSNAMNAFISEDITAASFAAALEECLKDPVLADQVGENGYKLGVELFDRNSVAERIERFINEL